MIPELRILHIRTWTPGSEHLPSRLEEEVRLHQLAIFIFNFCHRSRMYPKLTALVFNNGTPISDDWSMDGSRAYFVKAIQRDPWEHTSVVAIPTPFEMLKYAEPECTTLDFDPHKVREANPFPEYAT